MKQNVVGWFELPVKEMNRATVFYGHVFQRGDFVNLSNPAIEMMAFPWIDDAPNAPGALVKSEAHKPSKEGALLYFSCEDCAVEANRAEEAGGKIIRNKFNIGQFGFVAIVEDTEGNIIGLHSNH